LPKVDDAVASGRVEIIGIADDLGPVPAPAIGDAGNPSSGGPVAPIAETDPRLELDEDGLLGDRQAQPGRTGFEGGGSDASGHVPFPVGVPECPYDGGKQT